MHARIVSLHNQAIVAPSLRSPDPDAMPRLKRRLGFALFALGTFAVVVGVFVSRGEWLFLVGSVSMVVAPFCSGGLVTSPRSHVTSTSCMAGIKSNQSPGCVKSQERNRAVARQARLRTKRRFSFDLSWNHSIRQQKSLSGGIWSLSPPGQKQIFPETFASSPRQRDC
jgi:hypothetical protein